MNVWGNAFLTVSQIINLLPSFIIQGKTPHELLFHKKRDYTKFRCFGCACYPLRRSYNLNRLNFRFLVLLFGYSLCNKGYICRSSTGKIYISRHVVLMKIFFCILFENFGLYPNLMMFLCLQLLLLF